MVSIIIPTLNEAREIGAALDALAAQRGRFEIVVSDGDSTDGTPRLAAARPAVRVVSGPRGRARQLDRGAAQARAGVLLFLHADTRLPAGAIALIERLARRPGPIAGGFPHRYSRGGPLIRLASRVHSIRSRLSGVYYGDQAPFVSRRLFEELGGFGALPAMEDVDFARRLRRRLRPTRMPAPVVNSPRKLEARGVLRCGLDALYLLLCFRLGWRRRLARHPYFEPVR